MITEGGGASRSADPAPEISTVTESLTTSEPGQNLDAGLVVNGQINVRKTHPGLYRLVMATAIICIALGLNFLLSQDVLGLLPFQPTFFVWDMPNWVWAVFFLTIGLSKIVFLNLYRSLWLTRVTMTIAVAYLLFFAMGTMQPAFEGKGSLQLPILYVGLAALLVYLILEPFINPWTARRD